MILAEAASAAAVQPAGDPRNLAILGLACGSRTNDSALNLQAKFLALCSRLASQTAQPWRRFAYREDRAWTATALISRRLLGKPTTRSTRTGGFVTFAKMKVVNGARVEFWSVAAFWTRHARCSTASRKALRFRSLARSMSKPIRGSAGALQSQVDRRPSAGAQAETEGSRTVQTTKPARTWEALMSTMTCRSECGATASRRGRRDLLNRIASP
jgi:hypothetical protein